MPTPSSRSYSRDIVFLKRDPFARVDEVRRVCHTDETCAWCGYPGKRVVQGKFGMTVLYNYGEFRDGPNEPTWQKEVFCSKSCMQSFHGR